MSDRWKKEIIQAPRAPRTRSRSSAHAVRVGPLLFVTGQSGRPPGKDTYLSDPAEHARQTMENIKAILEEAGCSLEDIVRRSVHVSSAEIYSKMRPVMDEYFPSPVASTTFQGGLMRDDMLLEVEVIALVPEKQ